MKNSSCCENPSKKKRFDYLLYISGAVILLSYISFYFMRSFVSGWYYPIILAEHIVEITNTMSIGLIIGILFVGIIDKVPSTLLLKILGQGGTIDGVIRAAFAGVLLDVCSHGILIIAAELYKKGASIGQMIAFLIASPWNSFSLTLVLIALVGLKLTLILLVASFVIAVISGIIFDELAERGVIRKNPERSNYNDTASFKEAFSELFNSGAFTLKNLPKIPITGLKNSRMILRWIFFGVILASLIRTFVDTAQFGNLFGPSITGLLLTLLFATILEVCSEGSAPVAADIANIAGAPGNAFAFLMAGVSTDYTEIITIKEATKSWKIAFILPVITLPQIIIVSYLINTFS